MMGARAGCGTTGEAEATMSTLAWWGGMFAGLPLMAIGYEIDMGWLAALLPFSTAIGANLLVMSIDRDIQRHTQNSFEDIASEIRISRA